MHSRHFALLRCFLHWLLVKLAVSFAILQPAHTSDDFAAALLVGVELAADEEAKAAFHECAEEFFRPAGGGDGTGSGMRDAGIFEQASPGLPVRGSSAAASFGSAAAGWALSGVGKSMTTFHWPPISVGASSDTDRTSCAGAATPLATSARARGVLNTSSSVEPAALAVATSTRFSSCWAGRSRFEAIVPSVSAWVMAAATSAFSATSVFRICSTTTSAAGSDASHSASACRQAARSAWLVASADSSAALASLRAISDVKHGNHGY